MPLLELENMLSHPGDMSAYYCAGGVRIPVRSMIGGALRSGHPPAHTLIYGPDGVGKHALARVIARSVALPFLTLGDGREMDIRRFNSLFLVPSRGGIVFIDNVDALPLEQQSRLREVMLEGKLPVSGRNGPRFILPRISVVGAVTRFGAQFGALDGFRIKIRLEPLPDTAIREIVLRQYLAVSKHVRHAAKPPRMDRDALELLVKASGGLPRKAVELLLNAEKRRIALSLESISADIIASVCMRGGLVP